MKSRRQWQVLLTAGLMLCSRSLVAKTPVFSATILPEQRQTIKGWGCFPSISHLNEVLTEFQPFGAAQEALFRELGITIIRLDLRVELYDDQRDDGSLRTDVLDWAVASFIRSARDRGVTQYFFSVFSPPLPFKVFSTWRGHAEGGTESNRLKDSRENDYVRYLTDILKYLESKGCGHPVGLSLQNELRSAVDWQGCVYEKEPYQRVTKKLRKALDTAGLKDVLILGPEGAIIDDNWTILGGKDLPDLKRDPELTRAIGAIAHHTYNEGYGTKDPRDFEAYNRAAVASGKDLWMTEWSRTCGWEGETLDSVITTVRPMIRDLVLLQNNYYIYWYGWRSSDYPLAGALLCGHPPNLIRTKNFYIFKKLFNSARPGCVVRRLVTTDPDLRARNDFYMDMVAFEDKEKMTVLLVNHTDTDREMEVKGLKGRRVSVFQTTASEDMAQKATKELAAGTATVFLPAKSVSILVTSDEE